MKNLSTEKQMIEFAKANKDFLDFLYLEGMQERKKGHVELMVNDEMEIILAGFKSSNRRKRKFTDVSIEVKRQLTIENVITGYYRVYNSEDLKDLCYFQQIIFL